MIQNKYFISFIGLIGVAGYWSAVHPTLHPLWHFYLFTKTSGLFVSVLLSGHSLDKNNPFIEKLCAAKAHINSNCSEVLKLKAVYLFGLFAWSGLGLIYFLTLFVFLLLSSEQSGLFMVSVVSILPLSYAIYSIYFQWRIVKGWCRLCLITQAILLVEFGIGIVYLLSSGKGWSSTTFDYSLLFAISLAAVVADALLMPVISKWLQSRK